MSLSIAYENIDDASMRLQGTVVLYDGAPVYITSITRPEEGDPKGDIFRVHAAPLPYVARLEDRVIRKFISSRKFDMAPFPMGFMNLEGEAYYCTRLPRRQQRQGLSGQTFSAVCISDAGNNRKLEMVLKEQAFVDCIEGNYPSFVEALTLLEKNEAKAAAFDRHFAAVRDDDIDELIYLYHKKEKVGFLMEGKLKLSRKGRCLRESLAEGGVEC